MRKLFVASILTSGLLAFSNATMAACGGTPPQQWKPILDSFDASNRAVLDQSPQGGGALVYAFMVIAQVNNGALPALVRVGRAGNKKQRDSSLLGLAQAVAACRAARNSAHVDAIFSAVAAYGDRDYRSDLLKLTGDGDGAAPQRGAAALDLPPAGKSLGDPLKSIKPVPILNSTSDRL